MFGFIKQTVSILVLVMLCFVGSLDVAKFVKYVSINKQQYIIKPTLIDLNVDQRHCYLFIINMNMCDGRCNTIDDPFGRIYFPNNSEDMNLKIFNMIKAINESKKLAKQILCEC